MLCVLEAVQVVAPTPDTQRRQRSCAFCSICIVLTNLLPPSSRAQIKTKKVKDSHTAVAACGQVAGADTGAIAGASAAGGCACAGG
eukprot:4739162-Amphidinium_carterae.1